MAVLLRKRQQPSPKQPRPRKQYQNPTALPFDPVAAQQRRNLLERRQDYTRNYRQTVQNLNRNTSNQLRAIDIETPNVYRSILNNFAGRGMAYSSGYGTSLGNAANDIATQRTNLSSSLQDRLSGLQGDRRDFLNDYQYNLSQIEKDQANRAQSQAGNLGFDRNKPKKKKLKKRSK